MEFTNIEQPAEVKKEHYQAAMPTHPVQGQMGQLLVSFGMSKLEYAAIILAAGWWRHTELRRETIADEAVNMAAAILNEVERREKDIVVTSSSIITNGNQP